VREPGRPPPGLPAGVGGRRRADRRRRGPAPTDHAVRRAEARGLLRAGLAGVEVPALLRPVPPAQRPRRQALHRGGLRRPGRVHPHPGRRDDRRRALRPHPGRPCRGGLPRRGRPPGPRHRPAAAGAPGRGRPGAGHHRVRRRGAAREPADGPGVRRRRLPGVEGHRGRRPLGRVPDPAHRHLGRGDGAPRAPGGERVGAPVAPPGAGGRLRPGPAGPGPGQRHAVRRLPGRGDGHQLRQHPRGRGADRDLDRHRPRPAGPRGARRADGRAGRGGHRRRAQGRARRRGADGHRRRAGGQPDGGQPGPRLRHPGARPRRAGPGQHPARRRAERHPRPDAPHRRRRPVLPVRRGGRRAAQPRGPAGPRPVLLHQHRRLRRRHRERRHAVLGGRRGHPGLPDVAGLHRQPAQVQPDHPPAHPAQAGRRVRPRPDQPLVALRCPRRTGARPRRGRRRAVPAGRGDGGAPPRRHVRHRQDRRPAAAAPGCARPGGHQLGHPRRPAPAHHRGRRPAGGALGAGGLRGDAAGLGGRGGGRSRRPGLRLRRLRRGERLRGGHRGRHRGPRRRGRRCGQAPGRGVPGLPPADGRGERRRPGRRAATLRRARRRHPRPVRADRPRPLADPGPGCRPAARGGRRPRQAGRQPGAVGAPGGPRAERGGDHRAAAGLRHHDGPPVHRLHPRRGGGGGRPAGLGRRAEGDGRLRAEPARPGRRAPQPHGARRHGARLGRAGEPHPCAGAGRGRRQRRHPRRPGDGAARGGAGGDEPRGRRLRAHDLPGARGHPLGAARRHRLPGAAADHRRRGRDGPGPQGGADAVRPARQPRGGHRRHRGPAAPGGAARRRPAAAGLGVAEPVHRLAGGDARARGAHLHRPDRRPARPDGPGAL
ncbi:MAG: Protein lysine acetyltransferase Pat, partial [uncultured Friedmanniella sp.]